MYQCGTYNGNNTLEEGAINEYCSIQLLIIFDIKGILVLGGATIIKLAFTFFYTFPLFQFETHPVILYHCDFNLDEKDNEQGTMKTLHILHDLVQKQQQKCGRHPIIVQCL